MSRLFTAAALIAGAAAAASSWVQGGRSPASLELPFTLGVAPPAASRAALEATLWDVSDPNSPRFGAHESAAAVARLLAPAPGAAEGLAAFLASQPGVSGVVLESGLAGARVRGVATVAALELLAGCEFRSFSAGAAVAHRCAGAGRAPARAMPRDAFPPALRAAVGFLSPSTALGRPGRRLAGVRLGAGKVTPTVIRAQYGIGAVESASPANKQIAAGFLGEFANTTDLADFWAKDYPAATGRTLGIFGPNEASDPGVEAMLDVEYITAIGGNVNTTFHYTAGGYNGGNNEPYTAFVFELLSLKDADLPLVVSISYSDNENTVPADFLAQADLGFMALGVRGASVLGASGDGGVSGSQSGPCPGGVFIPTWPASSIYVTAVGATQGAAPEVVAGFSGGGFSNVYAPPAWQSAARAAYLASAPGLPASKFFNTTGAGIPDVAALGVNFEIVCGGETFEVDGTSCSTPTFAGLVSLLNDVRLSAGQSSLGFLNQIVYAYATAFTDITSGNNPGCNSNGFQATAGWDPITGVGSPVFPKLVAVVRKLPPGRAVVGAAAVAALDAEPAADALAAAAAAAAPRTPAVRGPAVTFAPNDVNLWYSPYTWLVTPTAASTINSGSTIRTLVSGTYVDLSFDVSNMVSPTSELYWKIDNGPLTVALVQSVVGITIPVNNTHGDVPYHTLEVYVKSTTERAARWAATGATTRVVFTGLATDGALSPWVPNAVNVLIYGDSITEGVLTLGGSQAFDTDHNDAQTVYSRTLGPLLGAEIGVVGFGATGLSRGGSGGVPALGVSYNQLWDGVPRVFSPRPDLIIFNEGTNDGNNNITAAFVTVVEGLLAACPGTPIVVMLPFNGAQRANLQATVAAVGDPNVVFLDTTGFYDTTYGGALHPTGPNDVAKVAPRIANAVRPLLARALVRRAEDEAAAAQ